jgi:dCMP deaminase
MRKYDNAMMATAHIFAKQSYANRRKVGAVLVKDGRILATGYNGTISGFSNQCEDENGKTIEFVLHAEQNVLTYCAKKGIPTEGATMYITLSPCKNCAKLIAQSGISEVVYDDQYKNTESLEFLNTCGVVIRQL